MIENFREISKSGIEVHVDLKGKKRYFDTDKAKVQEMKKDSVRGIKWESEGKTTQIFHDGYLTNGFPSVDLRCLNTIQYKQGSQEPPHVLNVYASDGSLLHQLFPQILFYNCHRPRGNPVKTISK